MQDSGEPDMFVLPYQSPDNEIPPVGTRVRYAVVTDEKSGRPRAQDVEIEDDSWLSS